MTLLTAAIAYELLFDVLAHALVTTWVMVIHVSAHTVLSHATASHYLVKLAVHPVFLHGEPSQFSQR